MRRSLRWFVFAIFCSSLGADAARAGWHHRRSCRPLVVVCQPVTFACPEPCCPAEPRCLPVAVCCEAGWADEGGFATMAEPESFTKEPLVGEELMAAEDSPAQLELSAELVPMVGVEEQPVEQPADATVGGGEPGSSILVEEPPPAEAEADGELAGPPVMHEPLTMEPPKDPVSVEPEAVPEPAATEPPAAAPAAEPEPVNIFEAEEGAEASAEPLRRWIHARGNRSLVARLVDLPDADSCLLEAAGHRIRVPLEQLSAHDQRYVQRTGERLAAARAAARSRDTAGL